MTSPVNQLWLLAAGPAELPSTLAPGTQNSLRGAGPIFAAITLIVLAAVTWAVFIRRSPKYRRRGVLIDTPPSEVSGRRRRRRHRREQRTRNPTRAETGGLPPPGTGGASPPPL